MKYSDQVRNSVNLEKNQTNKNTSLCFEINSGFNAVVRNNTERSWALLASFPQWWRFSKLSTILIP